jgi:hypothetical protein
MSSSNYLNLAMRNAMTDMLAAKLVRSLAHGVKNELEAYIVNAIQREMRNFVPILLRDIREQMAGMIEVNVGVKKGRLDDMDRAILVRMNESGKYGMDMRKDEGEEDVGEMGGEIEGAE